MQKYTLKNNTIYKNNKQLSLEQVIEELNGIQGNIIPFNSITTLDLDADNVLKGLIGKLKGFVIAGYDNNNKEYFSSSYADGGHILWLIERLKITLINL